MKISGIKITIIVVSLVFFLMPVVLAQDVHFTQIHATPLLLNPANTGISDYDFRLINNYRNQWRKIEDPYNTYSISADRRFFLGKEAMGAGACYVHDLSSGNHFAADKFYFSVSYSRFYKNHQFIVGLQPGMVFRNYNLSSVTFGSQFNGTSNKFDPALPSYEINMSDKLSYFDLNGGIQWRAYIKKYQITGGFSLMHLNRPVETFMKGFYDEGLPVRYNVHGNIRIPLKNRLDAVPMVLYSRTSGSQEFIGGGLLGYSTGSTTNPVKNIYGLALLRINPVRNFDAVMLGAGIRIMKIEMAISYDINVSGLRKATNFYGAFEISIIYRNINIRSDAASEPCYML